MNDALTNEENSLQVLRDARRFIAQGWCQNTLARDINGFARGSCESGAVRWCAIGAIGAALKVWHPKGCTLGDDSLRALAEQLPEYFPGYAGDILIKIADYNNAGSTSQCDVLALFDRAIHARRGHDFAAFRAATLTALEQVKP